MARLFYHKGVYQGMETPMGTAHKGLSGAQEMACRLTRIRLEES